MGRTAPAEDPCAADVRQFCSDVRVGGRRVERCLHDNEARLSTACKDSRAAAEARFRQRVEELVGACGLDADRLCSGERPGGGRVLACLIRQQDDLSSSCRSEVEKFQEAKEKISAIRAACRADAERVCADASEAESLVECLQANRDSLSETCRSLDPETALMPAELVDAVDSLNAQERVQEALQILQGIESVPFLRSQILLQFDSYQGVNGRANADRLIFNPQIVFGSRREFQLQLKVPVLAVYPYSPDVPAQTGLGAITTAFAWAFEQSKRVQQFVSIGLQWVSPVDPPVGEAWAVIPTYAISIGLARPLSLTGQVTWIRSFASHGFPELNLLVVEPIVVLNLPGRSFLALETPLGWNFVDGSFLPLIKGVVGLYLDRRKSLSASAWYQALLLSKPETSGDTEAEAFRFGVGAALSYFFDW